MKKNFLRMISVTVSIVMLCQICLYVVFPITVMADEEDEIYESSNYENSIDKSNSGYSNEHSGYMDSFDESYNLNVQEEPYEPVYPIYGISTSQSVIYFDDVYEGDTYQGTRVIVTNLGNTYVDIAWSQSGDDAFFVSADYDTGIEVNDNTSFSIFCEDGLLPGNYSGSVTLWPVQDYSRASQITIAFYVTVLKNRRIPIVTGVSVNPSNVSAESGSVVSFSAIVEGYDIEDYSVYWGITGANSSGTIIDGNGNLYIADDETAQSINVVARSRQDSSVTGVAKANVQAGNIQISVQANPNEGGVVTGGGTYRKGSNITINASANNGYVFMGWTVDGNSIANTNRYDIKNAKSSQTYIANFKKNIVYVQTNVEPCDEAGNVSQSTYVNYGGDVTISANPAYGYRFVYWKENNNIISYDKNLTISKLTDNRRLSAVFEKSMATVKIIMGQEGAGSVKGDGTYNLGTNVTVTATPKPGYVFNGWYCNNQLVSVNQTYTISSIDKDYCLAAGFAKEAAKNYKIKSYVDGVGGSISPTGDIIMPSGIPVTYIITPEQGYKISSVIVDNVNVGTNNSYTFTEVTKNHTISVKFEKKDVSDSNSAVVTVNNGGDIQSPTQADIPKHQVPDDLNVEDVIPDVSNVPYVVDDSDVDYHKLSGVLAKYDISREEARILLENGQGGDLFYEAYLSGYLQMTVNNDFSSSKQATSTGDFFKNPSIRNYDEVMSSIFSEDDLLDSLEGNQVCINIDITDYSNSIPWGYQKSMELMADKYKVDIDRYFDISVIKTSGGVSSLVDDFNGTQAEFVLEVPSDLVGNDLSIMHIHTNENGTIETEILNDIDDDPSTFTIGVSKLSVFAFVEPCEYATWVNLLKIAVVIIIVGLFTLVVFFIVKSVQSANKKKKKLKK